MAACRIAGQWATVDGIDRVEDGATAAEIMRLLGHASLTSSQTYIEVTAGLQRAAVWSNRTNRALAGPVREGPA